MEAIQAWMDNRTNNALDPYGHLPAFSSPLIGVALGEDSLFTFLKADIGPAFYWTPEEAFAIAYPDEKAQAYELCVLAWVLPQTEHTRTAHRKSLDLPCIEWSKARHYGEKVNENLRSFVVELFKADGYQACAPVLLPQWARALSDQYGFASSWSERHAAHVCGLGTFGLSDGLITAAGKAIRVGSVIVRRRFRPTPRVYTHHNEWCLFHSTGKCLACVSRCPAGAISEAGHDKVKCKTYIRDVTSLHVERHQLGFKVSSCGLCQTNVPCENQNPLAGKKP